MKIPRFARDVSAGVLVRGWTQVTALLVIIVAGRMLTSEAFGVFAVASVFIIIAQTMLYSGIYEYIIKVEDHDLVADTCFWLNLILAVGAALAICLLAPLIAFLAREPGVETLMLWLAPTALIAALTSWQEAVTLRRKEITTYYLIWFVAETASAAIAIALFYRGVGVFALVGYRYSMLAVTAAGYGLRTGRFPRLIWRAAEARQALAFASGLYGSRLIAIVSNFGADLIIGILASAEAAGAYRLASRMVFGVSEIWFQPIKTIAWVRFSSAIRAGLGLEEEWPALMMLLSMVAWPVLAAVAILSAPLIATILGSGWRAAAPIVSILAFAKATELFEVFLDPLLATAGQTRTLLRIRTLGSVIAIIGFLSLARFGAAAAAWAQFVTYLFLSVVTLQIGFRRTRVTPGALAATLLPGAVTTLCAALAAIGAAGFASRTTWPLIGQFAFEVGAVALLWAFLVGVVFRRKGLRVILKLRDHGVESAAV